MEMKTLAAWLQNNGYSAGTDAEQILVGQPLTKETAIAVRRMVNRVFLNSINCGVLADWVELSWPCNAPFLTLMIELIDAGTDCDTNWQEALYNTMNAADLKSILKVQEAK